LLNLDVYLALAEIDNSIHHQEIIRPIMANPNAWPAIVKSGSNSDPQLGKVFYADFGARLFLYYRIRDNVYKLQKDLSISGISQRHISIRDCLFSYPAAEELLILLESDRLTLQQAVPEIIKYFIQLVHKPRAYNLFSVDENQRKIPASVAAVENAAARTVRAEIYTQSHDWELTGANCWQSKHAYCIV
jgi:hypothetical protein